MTFLEDHFGRDFKESTPNALEALKAENERRAAEAEARDLAVVDHMPVWLNMTNTTRCNIRCIMCNQAYGRTALLRMDEDIYDRIVRELYPFLRTVQLTAIGEPMMTPKLPAKLDDMLRYGVRLEMVTNGTLLKGDAMLDRLAAATELITVSLDGARAETYNSIREGADFDEILANLKRFNVFRNRHPRDVRTRLNINCILMKRNIRELPDLVDLAADLGVQSVICSHLVLFEEGLKHEMLQHEPELSNAFTARAAERARERGVEIRLPPPFPRPHPERRSPGKGNPRPGFQAKRRLRMRPLPPERAKPITLGPTRRCPSPPPTSANGATSFGVGSTSAMRDRSSPAA